MGIIPEKLMKNRLQAGFHRAVRSMSILGSAADLSGNEKK